MAITIAAGALPDIPADVLAAYPKCVIYKVTETEDNYTLVAGVGDWYVNTSSNQLMQSNTNRYYRYKTTLGSNNWTEFDNWADIGAIPIGAGIVWANHDIRTQSNGGGEIFFAKSQEPSDEPEVDEGARYSAPAEWFVDMADEIRRLTETTDKMNHETMLSELQGLELSGGGGGYDPDTPTTYPDAENVNFGTTSAGNMLYTGKYFYGSYPTALNPFDADGFNYAALKYYTDSGANLRLVLSDKPLDWYQYDLSTVADSKYRYYRYVEDAEEWEFLGEGTGATRLSNQGPLYWTNHTLTNTARNDHVMYGEVKEATAPVPETVDSGEIEYIETAETYTISGATLTALGAVTQQITGIAATTPSAMVSALQMYAGTH